MNVFTATHYSVREPKAKPAVFSGAACIYSYAPISTINRTIYIFPWKQKQNTVLDKVHMFK